MHPLGMFWTWNFEENNYTKKNKQTYEKNILPAGYLFLLHPSVTFSLLLTPSGGLSIFLALFPHFVARKESNFLL